MPFVHSRLHVATLFEAVDQPRDLSSSAFPLDLAAFLSAKRLVHSETGSRRHLEMSYREFGIDAAERYQALLMQAVKDLILQPNRPSSRELPGIIAPGIRTYHMELSKQGSLANGRVLPVIFWSIRC